MPPIQVAQMKRGTVDWPLDCADDWGHDGHPTESFRSGHRRDDMPARIHAVRPHIVRPGIHPEQFSAWHSIWATDAMDIITTTPEETSDAIVALLHSSGIGQAQQAEQSVPADLEEALQELAEVTDCAKEDGLDIPSETAFANAERLLRDMYRFSPRVYSVYPMPDGYIAIDARGANGNIAVLMCSSDGGALCLVTTNGESRRARYSTARELPDGFVREALTALGPEQAR